MHTRNIFVFVAYFFISVLIERVFLKVGSADTDEQLETTLCKFLCPLLLKLASDKEEVRKKVRIKDTWHLSC